MADDVLRQGVQGITDLITIPGLINLDFADVRTIMQDAGSALMGIGTALRRDRARPRPRKAAISSPLLEESVEGATGILLNITGGATSACSRSTRRRRSSTAAADPNVEHHLRRRDRRAMRDEIRVTLIATGFEHGGRCSAPPTRRARPAARRADGAT